MTIWNAFTTHLRARFGQRVQKIPLDAGATCPNRDGTLSRSGCTFCNAAGSGSGLGLQGMDLTAQWAHWRTHFLSSGRASLFIAYLQSFSNTYGPLSQIRKTLNDLKILPDIVGLCVGTRPDCLDAKKIALLASMPWSETWVELGVQTFDDATLLRINRGHNATCSQKSIVAAAKAGLQVCVHLMAGLPGESNEQFLDSVRRVNDSPAQGVKFHNVYVCRNTPLQHEYAAGLYTPLEQQGYVDLMLKALELLRPDLLVHRVVADPAPDELAAPAWAARKHETVLMLEKAIRARHPELAKGAQKQRRRAEEKIRRAHDPTALYTVRRP